MFLPLNEKKNYQGNQKKDFYLTLQLKYCTSLWLTLSIYLSLVRFVLFWSGLKSNIESHSVRQLIEVLLHRRMKVTYRVSAILITSKNGCRSEMNLLELLLFLVKLISSITELTQEREMEHEVTNHYTEERLQ